MTSLRPVHAARESRFPQPKRLSLDEVLARGLDPKKTYVEDQGKLFVAIPFDQWALSR